MTPDDAVTVPAADARGLCHAVLAARGTPPAQAEAQTRLLVEADLRGRPSHGLQRLPTLAARIDNGLLDPAAEGRLRWRTSSFLAVDGGHGFGPHVTGQAIDALAGRAATDGVALGAIANASHIGMLAPYLEDLTALGLAGVMLTTSEALVHPAGGRTALVGTNPIGIGLPADPEPFVLDMSTAAISAGEVIAHAHRGDRLPEGRAVDAEGRSTTDPQAALAGAISPFGGAKGYGLALGFELLVALLTGSGLGREVVGTLDTEHRATKGDVILVVDPAAAGLSAPAAFFATYLDELRTAPTAPGVEAVLIPGDRMRAERARREAEGIAYPAAVWSRLEDLAGESAGLEARA